MSMGITLAPTDGDDVETLLKNADMAMYRAKDGGKNNYCYYRPEMDAEVRRWHRIHSEIRNGMERDEFRVFFQPKVEPVTGKVFGMEALARWITKDGEVIGPNEFIRVAEEAGLIEQLDRIILEQACGHTLEWLNAGHDLTVSVNLSPRHFQAADLPERIDEILARVGFPPGPIGDRDHRDGRHGRCRTVAQSHGEPVKARHRLGPSTISAGVIRRCPISARSRSIR